MGRFDPAGAAGRLARTVRDTDWKGRAQQAARSLRDEYEAGKRGDDAPVEPLWAGPREQFEAVLGVLRAAPGAPDAEPEAIEADIDDVTAAVRQVDWGAVRTATSERTGDAARAMKTMADQVDWGKVQPVATQLSSALIAAVAAGHLPVAGRLGSVVARTIVDQGGLGQRVAAQVHTQSEGPPPDFRGVIDVTARDA